MRRPRTYSKAATEARLNRDLSGRPIPFQRVPTLSGVRSRRYYNPYTDELATEDYVIRIYNPALKALMEEELGRKSDYLEAKERFRKGKLEYTNTLASSYLVKQQSMGLPLTSANSVKKDEEFKSLVRSLRVASFQSRLTPKYSIERSELYSPTGEYALLLVALGRRNEDDAFPVGMSPTGWASTVASNLTEAS